ncbi:hypothetical protein CAPTEDRAFT_94388 [Capitella teleta]|uniref:Adenosine 3'-phospho 5'-phosphosulfate transporter 1 n=1 Tax=Capitella teleta TaxID=283909 RepID=R7U576_CAPTE|nr:hypothetical protein CAPTEDRAFT_94388 [Capitella teleta]|eukprot:ELU01129.1 hypothetical protein CAPTEDRAFT_94388 [Capitella teleta]
METLSDFWMFRLMLNVIGYGSIMLPGYLLIRWVRSSKYLERAEGFPAEKGTVEEGGTKADVPKPEPTLLFKALQLLFCAAGLLTFYLTWGLLQERIMAFKYGKTDTDPGENFKNSQFLVFVNRILALVVAMIIINVKQQPRHRAPLYKYSFSSLSNIMSSWFQYEALKFVSFPVQVLAKASKVIPVMLMGKIISKRSYDLYEYLTAVMISLGVSMFLLTSGDAVHDDSKATTFSGVIILLGYLLFDAFTSNWQGEIFKAYKVSSFQMMAGVNFFSVIFTTASLVEQGGFVESLAFMARHPDFLWHSILLSICSAIGQLFIFYTISQFGAVTFTIIMTVRQGFAILLSCIIYAHPVTIVGILGIMVVFLAMFLRIHFGQQKKKSTAVAKEAIPQTITMTVPKA